MVVFALAAVVLLVVVVTLYVAGSLRWGLEPVFTKSCWIPVVLVLAAYVLRGPLMEQLGYAVVLVGLLIFLLSLVWTLIGVVLMASARQQGGRLDRLAAATVLASLPVLAAVVLLAIDAWR